MSDIVERLRAASLTRDELRGGWLAEAADEIEILRARVAELEKREAKLREALMHIARGDYSAPMRKRTPEQRAREALAEAVVAAGWQCVPKEVMK